jgi:hypothetical protein
MAETLGQVLNYINTFLPHSIASSDVVALINAEQRKVWEDLTSTNLYEFYTVANQPTYSLPTNCRIENIVENGVMIATSTGAVTTTTIFETYSYCGPDDELEGNRYYEALDEIGISPVPDNIYPARIKYQEYFTAFASSDTNMQFNLDQDYIDIIKFKVMSRIAKSGRFPNVELANNYEMDARELERKMKVGKAKEKVKTNRTRWSYQDWK